MTLFNKKISTSHIGVLIIIVGLITTRCLAGPNFDIKQNPASYIQLAQEINQRFRVLQSNVESPAFSLGQYQLPLEETFEKDEFVSTFLKYRFAPQIQSMMLFRDIDDNSFNSGRVKIGIGTRNRIRLFLMAGKAGQIYFITENGQYGPLNPTDSSLPIVLEGGEVIDQTDVEFGQRLEKVRLAALSREENRKKARKQEEIIANLSASSEGKTLLSLLISPQGSQTDRLLEYEAIGLTAAQLQIVKVSNKVSSVDLIVSLQKNGFIVLAEKADRSDWHLKPYFRRIENYLFGEQFSNGRRFPIMDRWAVFSDGTTVNATNLHAFESAAVQTFNHKISCSAL